MRAVTIALAAIPVVLGGLGLVVVAGGVDPLNPFVPASEDSPISPGPDPESGGVSQDSDSGTPIEGRRPHLSVIDGHVNLFFPATLPAILSLLPTGATDLSPLPPARGDQNDDAPTSTVTDPAGRQNAPATGTATGAASAPGPRTDTRPAPDPAQPPAPPVDGSPSAPSPWAPPAPDAEQPAPRPAPDPLPPRMIGDPRFDSDLVSTITDETENHGRPPHADTTGRPPHAGQNGPPGHAATGGRPGHAAGGAQKSDDSRPGPR